MAQGGDGNSTTSENKIDPASLEGANTAALAQAHVGYLVVLTDLDYAIRAPGDQIIMHLQQTLLRND